METLCILFNIITFIPSASTAQCLSKQQYIRLKELWGIQSDLTILQTHITFPTTTNNNRRQD